MYSPPIEHYTHLKLKRYQYQQSLRNIDWSLNRVSLDTFRVTSVWCDCARCNGHNRLLDWPKRSLIKWNGMPGACPYRIGLQLTRIALIRNEPIDIFIMGKLIRKSRQL